MQWIRRTAGHPPSPGPAQASGAGGAVERASPGVSAFFESIREDRSHAVLDLGPAAPESLRVYGRFARWVRFADVLRAAAAPMGWPEVLRSLPPNPARPYDLLVAWDVLDRLPPEHRPELVGRLAELSGPGARIFAVSASPESFPVELPDFTLVGTDRMRFEAAGEPRPVHPPVLPSEVKPLLAPFEVRRAFSTRVGLREYVAEKRTDGPPGSLG